MLTIVIPTLNEMKHGLIEQIITSYAHLEKVEVLLIDSYSNDGTETLDRYKFVKIIKVKTNSRAGRLNKGLEHAKGDFIIFNHPRSILEKAAIDFIEKNYTQINYWGAFTHTFDISHPLLKFTSFWSNYIRGDLNSIYYLDHCLYGPKKIFETVMPITEVDIFEDTILCQKLKKLKTGKRLNFLSTTSATRFVKNGIIKQAVLNQKMKLAFHLGQDHQKMNKNYEKNCAFNSEYKKSSSKLNKKY